MAGGSIVLATWNVHKGVGMDGRYDPDRAERAAASFGADILALQEVDRRVRCRSTRIPGGLLSRRGMRRIRLPRTNGPAGHGWHGNCLYVSERVEVERVEALELPGLEPRGALLSTCRAGGGRILVVACHLGLLRSSRLRQTSLLAQAMAAAWKGCDGVAVMGDTNEWRRDANRESSLRPWLCQGLTGCRPPSFPAARPLVGLDRVLATLQGAATAWDGPDAAVASDHRPVLATLAA